MLAEGANCTLSKIIEDEKKVWRTQPIYVLLEHSSVKLSKGKINKITSEDELPNDHNNHNEVSYK